MSAVVIGHISVKDPAKWAEYCAAVPATVAPWGAEIVFRGRRARLLGGDHRRDDTVILRFSDRSAVDSWFDSPAYQALLPLRMAAADVDLISFEG